MSDLPEIPATGGEPAKPRSAQLLTFFLDNQEYGVDILRVQEIRIGVFPRQQTLTIDNPTDRTLCNQRKRQV